MWAIPQVVVEDLVVVVAAMVLQQLLAELEIHHQYHLRKETLVVEMADLQLLLIVLAVGGVPVVQVGTLHLLLFPETVVAVLQYQSLEQQQLMLEVEVVVFMAEEVLEEQVAPEVVVLVEMDHRELRELTLLAEVLEELHRVLWVVLVVPE
jgi:hypothetical protein